MPSVPVTLAPKDQLSGRDVSFEMSWSSLSAGQEVYDCLISKGKGTLQVEIRLRLGEK